jgi:hypothetical protein
MLNALDRSVRSGYLVAALVAASLVTPIGSTFTQAAGINYYVAPTGLPSNDGSQARPLDLATALSASSPARPGDTIWLRGGLYSGNFVSLLNGAAGQPIIVRQYPGERATLDGAPAPNSAVLTVKGSYAWYWGFEVMNSYPNRASGASSRYTGVNHFGPYTKLINLVVHDALDGIGTWSGATDAELYGNVIYNNGGESGGVGAGHSIYVQNSTGIKRLVDNVMSNSYNFGIHVYTEGGSMDNVSMEGNIAFNHGVLASSSSYKANYFVGGSKVAQDPELLGNYGYYPWGSQGRNGDLGWGTACNSLNMQNNYLAGGTSLKVNCTNATVNGNFLYGSISSAVVSAYPSNVFSQSRPAGLQTFIRPNKYEPGRANIAVYNWDKLSTVSVDLSTTGLKSGDRFEIRDAQNFYGPAVLTATYNGAPVTLPMTGLTPARPIGGSTTAPPTGPEFNAFVVLPTGTSSTTPPAPTAALSASPSSVTAGQAASLTWSTANATSVSITPAVGGVSASGSVSVTPALTTTYTLTASGSGGTITKTATVTVTTSGGGGGTQASASFIKTDTATQGTWLNAYGKDGYALAGDATRYPAYAQVTLGGVGNWTWTSDTSDTRALQKASGSGRIAAVWYATGASMTMDVSLTTGAHQLALYVLDWDNQGRAETIQVIDRASGAVLDQRSVSAVRNGSYLVWQVSGNVRIQVTRTAGNNAIVNGVFFDAPGGGGTTPTPPPPPPSTSGGATFVKADTSTKGSWINTYGKDGYTLAGDATKAPSYGKATFANAASWTWSASTTDTRAEQKASGSGRVAATWYESAGSFTIDVALTDGVAHQLALYMLDWENAGRAETIQITNPSTGAVLDQRAVSAFTNGTYLVWTVTGSVRIKITRTQGTNAVVSGLFFN